jgi:hypothetical protein
VGTEIERMNHRIFSIDSHVPWQIPEVQTPLTQSDARLQCSWSAQGGHVVPPQSTSVSSPFLTLSEQVGAEKENVITGI